MPLRASDEERDEAVSELGERFAEGRLSHETFMQRMDEALGARDRRQLDGLFTDLPRRRPGAGALSPPARRASGSAPGAGARCSPRRPSAVGQRPGSAPPRAPPRSRGPGRRRLPTCSSRRRGPGAVRYTIGRDSRCDLLIEDTSVSRWHARLEQAAGDWLLTDLGSTNGTRLNGWRVHHPVPVQPGDQVRFGSARFVVRADRPGGGWPAAPGFAAQPGQVPPGQVTPGQAPAGQPDPGSG